MTNVNIYSDSQESLKSVLLDDDTFHDLQQDVRTMDGMDEILDGHVLETEQKCPLMYLQPQQHINIPVLDEFPGPYNFQLVLHHQGAGKHCVYSELLKKIFINMEQALPLRFVWRPIVENLWLRTTMVFALDQYRGDPVVRCHNHMAVLNTGNNMINSPHELKHVVRCLHPGRIYDEVGGHLSVLVPLGTPQAGSDYVPLNFKFYCKNSCTSGMNRRPTQLVFTLETQNGQVLGRRRLPVRVCSCPKRDKEKEETEQLTGKMGTKTLAGGKKRKLSVPAGKKLLAPGVTDAREYALQVTIPGRDNYQAVVKYAYDLLAGQATRTGQHDFVRPYLDDLAAKMQYLQ